MASNKKNLTNTNQKKPLDVIAAVKVNGQVYYFLHGKGRTFYIVAFARNAIGTVKNTVVGKQYL